MPEEKNDIIENSITAIEEENIPWDRIVKEGNCIVNANPTAKMEIAGKLWLNKGLPKGSQAECIVTLKDKSLLVVKGNFQFRANTDVMLRRNSQLLLGSGYINNGTRIRVEHKVIIGKNAAISWDCFISDSDLHSIFDENGNRINKPMPVRIGNSVWIGQGCAILKGVTIGDGAIIAAHAVVTKDIPPHTLAAGIPARVVRENVSWK